MPEYLSPGVYVEEVPSGPRPIQGVGTSTAGFVGQTERGPTRPRLVTSKGDFASWFGGTLDPSISYLPLAVGGFFDNGGQRLYVARIVGPGAAAAQLNQATADGAQTLEVRALGEGEWGNRIFFRIQNGTQTGIRLTILYYEVAPPLPLVDPLNSDNIGEANRREPDIVEDHDDLGVAETDPNFLVTRINAFSQLIALRWGDEDQPAAQPNNTGGFVQLADVVGSNGNSATAVEYTGENTLADPPDQRTGIAGLATIDPIAILCVPDDVHPALDAANQARVVTTLLNQCELLRDRFAILNVPGGIGTPDQILANRPGRDTTYGAIYCPWIRVFDPRTQSTVLIPPGGHTAGIYARTDIERGVHKAPANEVIRGIITRDIGPTEKPLEFTLGKGEQDLLNPSGVNVIRDFRPDGRGIRVWGARTRSSDPQWRYINVRRLFLFVEESIDEGTQWAVFEPNDEPLWAQIRQTIRNFLLLVWRSGALQGQSEEEAFFVRCDRSTMTQADIDAGRLICLIGIAPVKPAEFVIFRIQQKTLNGQG